MATQRSKDKLRPASFRGVRFLVDSYQLEGGRRGPDHQFPDRDEPYAEDTGRSQRKYDIEAYLVGPDYYPAKKKLLDMLEKKGSGDFVHPYYGRKKVMVRGFTVQETAAAGGFVKVSIKFVEAGSLIFPKSNADRAFLVGLAGSLLGASAATALTDAFNTADQAQFVIDSATDKLLAVAAQMDSISAGIVGAADPIAAFAFAVRNLKATAIDLVLSPVALANNIADAFSLLFAASSSPSDSFTAGRKFFSFGSDDPTVPATTASRLAQIANSKALNAYVKTVAAINVATVATTIEFKSVEDASSVRDQITDHLDTLMEETTSDDVYSALQGLRAQVTQAIPGETKSLAHVSEVTPLITVPSLVLSYELYGSVDQEQDLIDRNAIRHPGFVMGGRTLEVLGNG